MPTPTVSVIIPAHNAARTLPACIASVRASEYGAPVEVVVVDDASSDNTVAIAKAMDCVVVCRRTNSGPAVARNAGAKAATGDVLLFVDADTEMLSDTIRNATAALSRAAVGAVVGMYEPEPINRGFFPCYYAYLKYYAYTCSTATRLLSFGAHCAAITKNLFEQVGGYRSIAWGVDVENEEFGRRINEILPVVLERTVRVRHNFPTFRKLLRVFTRRVYWWVLFRRHYHADESILMTRGIGLATAAASLTSGLALFGCLADSGWPRVTLVALAAATSAIFLGGFRGLWNICWKRRGFGFALGAIAAAFVFSHVIVASAIAAHGVATWRALRHRSFPFAEAALGQS